MPRHKNIKTALIEETIRQVAAVGHARVTLRSVAAHCGIAHSSVYKHFASRQALLDATHPYIRARLYAHIRRACAQKSECEPFIVVCAAFIRFMRAHPTYFELLYTPQALRCYPTQEHPLHYYFASSAPVFHAYFQRCGVPESARNLMASLCGGLLCGVTCMLNQHALNFRGSYEQLVEQLCIKQLHLVPLR
nr:TetR/AcrR family transcriptional regulator [Maliibacterium massiliense]